MLLAEKNQNWPVSPVRETPAALPPVPWDGTRHSTSTLNRPPFRQSVVALGLQPASDAAGSIESVGASRVGPACGAAPLASSSPATALLPPMNAAVSATLARWPDGFV